jgi:hypothetical protein
MRLPGQEYSLTTVYRTTVLLLLIAGSLMSQAPINTIPSWDGVLFGGHFGVPNTATIGQTITIGPGSAVVTSFGFEIGCNAGEIEAGHCYGPVNLRGEIYAWDGTKATGPSLFESPVMNLAFSSSYNLVIFNTGALTLPPGNYVIFATTSRDQVVGVSPLSKSLFGALPDTTAYPGGVNVYLNNGADTSQWTSVAWVQFPWDAAFLVNMDPAPPPTPTAGVPAASPATLLLGFAGVIALGLLGMSRLRTAR